ncbi:hypothetical protein RB601_003593 [Gaeumannomyces tritici]
MNMSDNSTISFAIKVVERVREQALELSREKGLKGFYSGIAIHLGNVKDRLEASGPTESDDLQRSLPRLMRHLDHLVQWPARSPLRPKTRKSAVHDTEIYAALHRMLAGRLPLKKSMRELGIAQTEPARGDRKKLQKVLEGLAAVTSTTKTSDISDINTFSKHDPEPNDHHVHLKLLYDILSRHCVCQLGEDMQRISTNIRLSGNKRVEKDDDTVTFGLLFLDHPHDNQGLTSWWQNTLIYVSRGKKVQLLDSPCPKAHNAGDKEESIPSLDFCQTITKRTCAQLEFIASGETLTHHGAKDSEQDYMPQSSSIPLSGLLGRGLLTRWPKSRLRLCSELAKAAWQFYDSGWMQRAWTKSMVNFILQRRNDRGCGPSPMQIFVDDPLLSARFDTTPSDSPDKKFLSHKFPKVLSLGIMMMEIELDLVIEDHFSEEFWTPDGNVVMNSDYITAGRIFEQDKLWDSQDTFPDLKDVIGMCLKPDFLNEFYGDSASQRDAIYKKVVKPLETLDQQAFHRSPIQGVVPPRANSIPNQSQFLEHDAQNNMPYLHPSPAQELGPVFGQQAASGADDYLHRGQPASKENAATTSERWFAQLDPSKAASRIKPKNRDPKPPLTRVAIIDTEMPHPHQGSPSEIESTALSQRYISGSVPELRFTGLFDDSTPGEYSEEVCRDADQFIQRHRDLSDKFTKEPGTTARIKVAILDTGLDLTHPTIKDDCRGRIKDWKSWLPGRAGTDVCDASGHGTHVAALLLDIAPESDVYIAQIADAVADADPQTVSPHQIAEAVRHAVMEWQVDIITMSFGFQDEMESGCRELAEAIRFAHASKVLTFAAASNVGAHAARPAFPARMSEVFCIYSGDGMGTCARTCPTASGNHFNFLTLGEAVESAWPRDLCQKHQAAVLAGTARIGRGNPCAKTLTNRKSGTSFATPIAAGIAAFLLLYAAQTLPEERAKILKEHDKMEDFLYHLSSKRGGYDVLSITDFFKRREEERKMMLESLLDGRPWKA